MFEYKAGTKPENGIRVSPSGVDKLLTNHPKWMQEFVYGIDRFQGNANTRLGTIVHALIENYYIKKYSADRMEEKIEEYLEKEGVADRWEFTGKAYAMFNSFVENYASKNVVPDVHEGWVEYQPNSRIVVSGSFDALDGKTVVDYKTTRNKKDKITIEYRRQLYMYAWALRQNGTEIDSVRIVYIQQPLKSGNCNIYVDEEPIDEEFMADLIDDVKDKAKIVLSVMDGKLSASEYLQSVTVGSAFKAQSA